MEVMGEERAKPCSTRVDRISQLSEELLTNILSCLHPKEAARTSVLSSRWRKLWKFTSRLNFEPDSDLLDTIAAEDIDGNSHFHAMVQYALLVDKVLQLCETHTLLEFSIYFDLDNRWRFMLDKWIKYAFARQVQRLELNLLQNGETLHTDPGGNYVFPEELLTLAADGPPPIVQAPSDLLVAKEIQINFESLKVLSLKCVNIKGEALQFFLSNCPVLEQLVVWGSNDLYNLEVSDPSLKLKHLEIRGCDFLFYVKVCNVNLRSLSVAFVKFGGAHQTLLLKNLPMLTDVSISKTSTDFFNDVFTTLSCCLPQLEILTLCGGKPKEIVKVQMFPELKKVKKLVLRFWADRNKNFLELVSLVESAPLLEELVLELAWYAPKNIVRSVDRVAGSPHHFLKSLTISGYCGRIIELELVRFFLENADSLEKIIVDPRMIFRSRKPMSEREISNEQNRRTFVKQQLEAELPEHIELVVL